MGFIGFLRYEKSNHSLVLHRGSSIVAFFFVLSSSISKFCSGRISLVSCAHGCTAFSKKVGGVSWKVQLNCRY